MATGGIEKNETISDGGVALFPVKLTSLRVDTLVDFDLYIRPGAQRPPVLYRERNLPFTADVFDRLAEHGASHVYIPTNDRDAYRRYIEANLPAVLADESLPMEQRSELLYDSAQGLLIAVFEEPRAKELVQRSRELVQNTSEFLRYEADALPHLLKVISFDYYTYTHSVNVFVFSMMLAQHCGVTDPAILQEFGEGTLLHDVGKSQIDSAIVNCRGKLDDTQWAEMKRHPVYGFDILSDHGTLGAMALDVVRHHHEKLNGKGYPDGLANGDISFYVRISTVCDIFDALTTRRTYKDALGSFPALKLMKEHMSEELDPDIFRVFVGMMGNAKS